MTMPHLLSITLHLAQLELMLFPDHAHPSVCIHLSVWGITVNEGHYTEKD